MEVPWNLARQIARPNNEKLGEWDINPKEYERQQQIAQIETGKTTKQWVLTNLGIPDRTQADKDGLEVFEYQSQHSEKSNKTFIFLFNVDSDKVISRKVTRVVMRNGIVETVNTNDLP